MSLDADTIVDRRRMRRKLTFWRVFAILIAICAVVAAGAALRVPGTGVLTGQPGAAIARVTFTGLIRSDQQRVEALERLGKSRAQAVIVHINSPGGTTSGSEQLYESLMRLKEKKPIVVVIDGLAASGAYIAALGADHIVAQETSLVGSIGVLFQYPNVADLLKTLGIKVEEIKSSPLKASPNGFEPTSPEARAAIESIVLGFLRLVPRPGEGAPAARRCRHRAGRRRTRVHRAPGGRAQARRPARRRADGARLARQGEEHRSEHAGARLPAARPAQRLAVPAYRGGCGRSKRWAWARSPGTSRSGARCRRWSVSALTVFWPFGTLRLRTRASTIASRHGTAFHPRGQGTAAPMIKSELVQRISAQNPHLYQRDVENIVNAILGEIIAAMARGDRVELRGFGAFSVKHRPARTGRNPRTGAHVSVDKKSVPFFKTGKEMRERLNRPSA